MRQLALPLFGASFILTCMMGLEVSTASAHTTTAIARSTPASEMAPADEYFGQYHVSILGMRNALHDYHIRTVNDPHHGRQFFNSVVLTEDAMRDWSTKFPKDPLVPQFFLSLERLYLSMPGADASERAKDTVALLDTLLPASPATRLAHTMLEEVTVVADDGTPVTDSTPAVLGVIPGLLPEDPLLSTALAQTPDQ